MKLAIQKSIYSGAMLIAPALVIPPFLFFKRGREKLFDRLGFWNLELEKSIWLHGASLGEMVGLSAVAAELRKHIDLPIVASSTSPTAIPKAQQFTKAVRLLPFDHTFYFKNCIKKINPKCFIFGETEIWPNLLSNLNTLKIPSYLVNGRISDRAFNRYLSYKPIVSASLNNITHIFAASDSAKDKFIDLGAPAQNVSVVSNTKYDLEINSVVSDEEIKKLRVSLFESNRPIITLSSIRPGEESILFEAIKSLEEQGKQLHYIIAPRHAEKFSFFENKLNDYGFKFERRSQQISASKKRFLFLDTIGELANLLQATDIVFVGGTFADFGGHNPLEPANLGVVPVVGPHTANIQDIVEKLKTQNAILQPSNISEVKELLTKVNDGCIDLKDLGIRAKNAAQTFKGGAKIIVEKILNDLKT